MPRLHAMTSRMPDGQLSTVTLFDVHDVSQEVRVTFDPVAPHGIAIQPFLTEMGEPLRAAGPLVKLSIEGMKTLRDALITMVDQALAK